MAMIVAMIGAHDRGDRGLGRSHDRRPPIVVIHECHNRSPQANGLQRRILDYCVSRRMLTMICKEGLFSIVSQKGDII